jgi:hypothetical protein
VLSVTSKNASSNDSGSTNNQVIMRNSFQLTNLKTSVLLGGDRP